MSESTTRQIVLASRPHDRPQADNFRLEQAAMPTMPNGGVLLRVLYISLDPYMRVRMASPPITPPMPRAIYSSRQQVSARTRRRAARACASSTLRSPPSPPDWACWGCLG